jgi:sortase A
LNKGKHSRGKRPLVTFLSLGLLVLGIGCVSWAAFGIWSQSDAQLNKAAAASAATVETTPAPAPAPASVPASAAPVASPVAYATRPVQGDTIGTLAIPALKRTLPLLEGTVDKVLVRGVGHYTKSVLPGEADNCVVSGHRDTVFRQLNKLKIGDRLIVKTSAGTFTYAVSRTRIVHADDRTVIVPTDHAVLTMTTCYPFHYIGSAPDRYVVSADLVTGN